jgi:predicted O-methyltransferase YrrM
MVSGFADEMPPVAEYFRLQAGGALGPGYGPIESQLLHCVIRSLTPKRVIEIGSGLSTAVTLTAMRRNYESGGQVTELTCIEPYPRPELCEMDGFRLVRQRLQDVAVTEFDQLDTGDVLFIDSTHSVHTGSELPRIYLEIIPRLRRGTVIHIHDIYLPFLYSPDILASLFDWQETTLVAALLTGNRNLKVLACLAALHHDRPAHLAEMFPEYDPRPMDRGLYSRAGHGHFPSSLWLAVV